MTVEKKEGKLKKHGDVTITDLPGIYSLSPYTLEEVVARNYLIGERPDAILNIIDGTNLERNLYLTTQLTELGIPVVLAVNMIDLVDRNGDKIDIEALSRQLGCRAVVISALKGTGVMEAAEAAVEAAQHGKTVPMHTFSGPVEHALAHIEEAAVHALPEDAAAVVTPSRCSSGTTRSWTQMNIPAETFAHIEQDIRAAETELDDDAESIITNERYVYIAEWWSRPCYRKKRAGNLTTSDKIDRVVTNRWLGLPIFAVVMFLVYWIAMVAVGAPATDWANDGLFGDGYHLFGIDGGYAEVACAVCGGRRRRGRIRRLRGRTRRCARREILRTSWRMKRTLERVEVDGEPCGLSGSGKDARGARGGARPADYGVWVPGIPALAERGLDAINTADWLKGLILDGIVAGVGAVLGFVPQMLVLFLLLAFLEACGYMARIAFVLDRVFRKFGLSGISFIPMLIGVGCGVPGIMASRTIENEARPAHDHHDDHLHPLRGKGPVHRDDRGRDLRRLALGLDLGLFHRHGGDRGSGHHAEEDEDVRGQSRSLRHGAARLPLADPEERPPLHVERGWSFIKKAGTIILLSRSSFGSPASSASRRTASACWRRMNSVSRSWRRSAAPSPGSSRRSAGATGRPPWRPSRARREGEHRRDDGDPLRQRRGHGLAGAVRLLHGRPPPIPSWCSTCSARPASPRSARSKREMNNAKWTWFAIGYQCGFAYLVALMINQFGGLFTGENQFDRSRLCHRGAGADRLYALLQALSGSGKTDRDCLKKTRKGMIPCCHGLRKIWGRSLSRWGCSRS